MSGQALLGRARCCTGGPAANPACMHESCLGGDTSPAAAPHLGLAIMRGRLQCSQRASSGATCRGEGCLCWLAVTAEAVMSLLCRQAG